MRRGKPTEYSEVNKRFSIRFIQCYVLNIAMNSKEKTTILVTRKTCEELKSLGRKGETYDDIITRLIREINRQEFIAQQYKKLEEKDKFIPLEGL